VVFLAHIFSRSTAGSFDVEGTDLEDVKELKDRDSPSHFLRLPNIQNQSLLSGLAYCIASCSMILVNKFVLSGYGFNAGIFLMLYQVYFLCQCFLCKLCFLSVLCLCCLGDIDMSSSSCFAAEHCIRDYCFYTVPLWCYLN
jgi:hypothetical protein